MKRTAFTWIELLVVFAIIVILLALLGGSLMEVPFQLLFGWVPFLYRSFFRMQLDGNATLTAVVCLLGLIAGLHLFLRWWRAQKQPERPWQLGATLSLVGVVVLMFVAGVSAVGVTHQTAWLATSPEPWLGGGMRGAAAHYRSQNNLRQISLALHNHSDSFGKMPPGVLLDADGQMLHGWQTMLLPYLEEDALFKSIKLQLAWDHPENAPHFRKDVKSFLRPDNPVTEVKGFAASHYASNVHVLGGERALAIPKDFPDGVMNTLLVAEVVGLHKPWGHPAGWRDPLLGFNKSPRGFGSPSKDHTLILLGNGSVRSIRNDVSPAVLKALSTPDGGEKAPDY